MKKDIIGGIIGIIALIVIIPLVLMYRFPWMVKAFLRYISDKDKSDYTFFNHLTDVRHESKSFNKCWREAAPKGIYVD